MFSLPHLFTPKQCNIEYRQESKKPANFATKIERSIVISLLAISLIAVVAYAYYRSTVWLVIGFLSAILVQSFLPNRIANLWRTPTQLTKPQPIASLKKKRPPPLIIPGYQALEPQAVYKETSLIPPYTPTKMHRNNKGNPKEPLLHQEDMIP